jgi:hypothetical protein
MQNYFIDKTGNFSGENNKISQSRGVRLVTLGNKLILLIYLLNERMTEAKLESLPNELLLDIFEHFSAINLYDVFQHLNSQLF